MFFSFSAKQQRFLFVLMRFSAYMLAFFVATIVIIDEFPEIRKKVKKIIYKIVKPEIPSVMNMRILKNLQAGGHTVFIRHSAREEIKNLNIFDQLSMVEEIEIPPPFFKGGCLNPQGKTEAWLIGEVFRKLNISVGEVYASPTCRTRETAKMAFNRIDLIAPELYYNNFFVGTGYGTKETRIKNKKKVLELIKVIPAIGKNNIIVAHSGMLRDLGWSNSNLKESGIFIFKHVSDLNVEVVTEITLGKFIGAMRLEGMLGSAKKGES